MKKKLIALTLATSVMLTGAGYAYWTDKLVLDNTVSTGEFNVKITSASTGGRTDANPNNTKGIDRNADGSQATEWGKYVYSDAYADKHKLAADDAMRTTVSQDGKLVTANIGNLYPGSSANLSVRIVNDGTIPAVFDYATVDITGSPKLQSEMVYWLHYKIVDQDPATKDIEVRKYYGEGNFSSYADNLNALLKGVRLEPNQELILGEEGDVMQNTFSFRLPSTVDNADGVEKKAINLKMKLNWKQHNADDAVVEQPK